MGLSLKQRSVWWHWEWWTLTLNTTLCALFSKIHSREVSVKEQWEYVMLNISVFQYDFVELLDGSRLISKEKRALSDGDTGQAQEEESVGGVRHARSVNVHEAGFIQYLATGIWHLAFYNDGRNTEQVSYNTIVIGETQQGACRSVTGRFLFTGVKSHSSQQVFKLSSPLGGDITGCKKKCDLRPLWEACPLLHGWFISYVKIFLLCMWWHFGTVRNKNIHHSSNAIFELLDDLGADLEPVTRRSHATSPSAPCSAAVAYGCHKIPGHTALVSRPTSVPRHTIWETLVESDGKYSNRFPGGRQYLRLVFPGEVVLFYVW